MQSDHGYLLQRNITQVTQANGLNAHAHPEFAVSSCSYQVFHIFATRIRA